MTSLPPRRRCARCLRAACVCAALQWPGVPVATPVELLILQHPREQREAKGSARLLHLAVAGSRLLVGDDWAVPPPMATPRTELLLYPPTPDDAALAMPPPVDPTLLAPPQALRLVVIDGTWRKARRMLYGSPWLQGLPRLALRAPPASRYPLRRARGADQRSTFEAALLGLQMLAPDPAAAAALWQVFDRFVAAARESVPPDRLRAAAGMAVAPRAATQVPGRTDAASIQDRTDGPCGQGRTDGPSSTMPDALLAR